MSDNIKNLIVEKYDFYNSINYILDNTIALLLH